MAREMDVRLGLVVLLSVVLDCTGVSIREQLAHIAKLEEELERYDKTRRFGAHDESVILGAPSYPSHLPEAEPILPGHTLIRPAIGMLKSAVKYPHRDLDNGAGVYGNIKNLGLRYDGKNERVMYSGFRRSNNAGSVETDSVSDSDSSSDETPSLRLRKENKSRQRNIIKKYIKIFPFETKNKHPKELHHNIENLKLYVVDSKGRLKRNIKRSIDTKLHSSTDTYDFAKFLIQKLKEQRKKQNKDVIILQPGSLDKSYESNSLEEISQLKSYSNLQQLKTIPSTLKFPNNLLKKLPNRQRRQQNIVVLQPVDTVPKYEGGVDMSLENITSLATERPRNWFYKDKELFNHIIIRQDAIEQEDLFPRDYSEEKTDVRNWWYYHQDDFIPFEEKDI